MLYFVPLFIDRHVFDPKICTQIDPRTNRIILMGAIDNLVKGAAGQAVQNMNLLFGYKEQEGLELIPMFP